MSKATALPTALMALAVLLFPGAAGRAGDGRDLAPARPTPVQDRYVLPDPAYVARPAGGEPVRPRVRQLVYPTLGFPALVPYGGEMDLIVRTARVPERPADWHAQLASIGGSPRYPLAVHAVAYDPLVAALRIRAAVSARAPRDVYDLELSGPGGFYDAQPRAVRVYGSPDAGFRFAVTADHQLWDPSWKQHSGDQHAHAYPRRGEKDPNRAMERQVRHELALVDPDFVLDAGDLVFG